MGAALERLSSSERDSIARSILAGCDDRRDIKIGAHCPFHSESTPGGAFYYDVDKDFGFCHSCRESGDLIDVYAVVNGMSRDDPEAFRSFWREFAPDKLRQEGGGKNRARASGASGRVADAKEAGAGDTPERGDWTPTALDVPPDLWREKAHKFVMECAMQLQDNRPMLDSLAERWGISEETARLRFIGYNPKDQYKTQTGWGLPEERNEKGDIRKIYLPQGLVFPVFGPDGKLLRGKIRMDSPKQAHSKYWALKGGSANCYGVWTFAERVRVWLILETERDAIVASQELCDYGPFGAMGVGTARLAPDAHAHDLLQQADIILNCLDSDKAGALASWRFGYCPERFSWNQTYPHVIRWPVPKRLGKDLGDMLGKLGVWEWIAPALPDAVASLCEKTATKARLARKAGQAGGEHG